MREVIRLLRSLVIQVHILEIKSGGRQTKTRLALLFPKVKRSSFEDYILKPYFDITKEELLKNDASGCTTGF